MTTVQTNYEELIRSLVQAGIGQGMVSESDAWIRLNNGTYSAQDFYDLVSTEGARQAGFRAVGNADGTIRSYTYIGSDYPMQEFTYDDVMQSLNSNYQSGTASAKNTFTMQQPTNATLEGTAGAETVKTSGGLIKYTGAVPSEHPVAYTLGSVTQAVMAAGWGIQLGKAIDGAIYDIGTQLGLDPPETLNPATWSSITSDDDSLNAKIFNTLLGINPNTGQAEMYAEDQSLAYMAAWMYKNGFFGSGENESRYDFPSSANAVLTQPIITSGAVGSCIERSETGLSTYSIKRVEVIACSGDSPVYALVLKKPTDNGDRRLWLFSESPFTGTKKRTFKNNTSDTVNFTSDSTASFTYNNITVIAHTYIVDSLSNTVTWSPEATTTSSYSSNGCTAEALYVLKYGTTSGGDQPDGVTNQPNAQLPNTSGWDYNDPNGTILPSLQQQYPDLWDNRVENDVVQPDGTTKTYTYIPWQMPSGGDGDNPDTTNNNQNLNDPSVDPDNSTDTTLQTIIQFITSLLPQGMTDPETQPSNPTGNNDSNPNPDIPNNPPDTGSGSTPVPVSPTGSASCLWKVYHPSQAELDSFGAWLWSSNFVEQIKKMFNDPMSAIIGLHKVFASPVDAGTTNIKVGYLDSGVSSAYVEQQYVTIDCGSIRLDEYFGNVFDYDPYTKVSIYLPFIGVQRLNTAEVMRSTVNVVYHVDIFTGACLAEVNINRDGGGGCLYTYSGDASARYPLSSGSYMGIVGGILSIAGGVVGTIASGGAMLPLALGAGAAATHMKADIQHSGQITGNAGAMGIKKPFLVILRPQAAMAYSYEHFTGRPSNSFVIIRETKGYIRCKEVHVDNIVTATSTEKDMIEKLLKNGVII